MASVSKKHYTTGVYFRFYAWINAVEKSDAKNRKLSLTGKGNIVLDKDR